MNPSLESPPPSRPRAPRLRRLALLLGAVLSFVSIGTITTYATSGAQPQPPADAGVPDGTTLSPSGSITVTQNGATVDGKDVNGHIWVKADNVTIRNTRVTYGGWHSIRIFPGATGTVVEDVEVDCRSRTKTKAIVFGNYRARRVEASGCARAFVAAGGNVVVEDSVVDGVAVGGSVSRPTVPNPWLPLPSVNTPVRPTTTTTAAPTTTTAPAPSSTTTTTAAPPATTQPTTSTTVPWFRPGTGDYPSAATTGFAACGRSLGDLRPLSGVIRLGDGQVLENFDLSGHVEVIGNDVTVRCGRIRSGGRYAITGPTAGGVSYLVEDVQMIGTATDTQSNSAGISPFGSYTARRVDISRFRDGAKVGTNQTIEDSWIHGLWNVPGAHNDGIQSTGGRNVTIRHNNIEGNWRAQTSALLLLGERDTLFDYTISDNRLSGGGYTVYIGGKDGVATPQGVTFTNNEIVSGSYNYGPTNFMANWPDGDREAATSGNILSDGARLSIG